MIFLFQKPSESKNFYLIAFLLFSFDFFLLTFDLSSQPNTWVVVYGGKQFDRGKSIVQTYDGGYMAVSSSSSFGTGSTNFYLLKLNSAGKYEWGKSLGGMNVENAFSVKQTPDSGFVFCGSTNSSGAGGYDAYLVKTDVLGNLQWENTYGSSDWDFAYWAEPTADGGYILAGESYLSPNSSQSLLVKTDSNGDTLWIRTPGVQGPDNLKEVHETPDGFIAAGTTTSDAGDTDFYLVKTDALGNILWEKSFGTPAAEECHSVSICSDGGFVLGGCRDTISLHKTFLLKTDSDGNQLMTGTEMTAAGNRCIARIFETNAGTYAALQNTDVAALGGGLQIRLDQYSTGGWWVAGGSFGGSYDEIGYDLIQAADSGFVVIGYTDTYSIGPDNNIFIVKTDKNGAYNAAANNYVSTADLMSENTNVHFFPNPASSKVHISAGGSEIISVRIFSLMGDLLLEESGTGLSSVDLSPLCSGIYFAEILTDKGAARKKVVLSK